MPRETNKIFFLILDGYLDYAETEAKVKVKADAETKEYEMLKL